MELGSSKLEITSDTDEVMKSFVPRTGIKYVVIQYSTTLPKVYRYRVVIQTAWYECKGYKDTLGFLQGSSNERLHKNRPSYQSDAGGVGWDFVLLSPFRRKR